MGNLHYRQTDGRTERMLTICHSHPLTAPLRTRTPSVWHTHKHTAKCVGRQESFSANRWGRAGCPGCLCNGVPCLYGNCTSKPQEDGEGRGEWQRDGRGGVGAGWAGRGWSEPGEGQDQGNLLKACVCVCVCQAPERTGGTRNTHPLDLSGPPARTQPTSPPHLAYLRWEIWGAWGPCKAVTPT